jgi:lysophospholipase L1-like esterase
LTQPNYLDLLRVTIDDFDPDLTIIGWGYNEPERNAAEFRQDVKDFVTRALSFGDVLILVTAGIQYVGRIDQLYSLVDDYTDHVALIDCNAALHDPVANHWWSDGTPNGTGSDIHPNNAGHDRMARAIYGIL